MVTLTLQSKDENTLPYKSPVEMPSRPNQNQEGLDKRRD